VVTETHFKKSGLRLVLALAAVVALFALPTQAMANENCSRAGNDPTAAQYCAVAGVHAKGGESNGGPTSNSKPAAEEPVVEAVQAEGPVAESAAPESSGTLPFTGLDVGILAIVAAALVGTGFVLRRLTASGDPRS
jgi:hypothetical protein